MLLKVSDFWTCLKPEEIRSNQSLRCSNGLNRSSPIVVLHAWPDLLFAADKLTMFMLFNSVSKVHFKEP